MCKMLLSINPQYVESILVGKKLYEYRKIKCKKNIDKIIIYSTYPVKKVIGEVEVLEILRMDKEDLWLKTKEKSGISKSFYDSYYQNKTQAVAYKLGKVIPYDRPKELKDIGIKVAPQSFMYME